MKPTDDKAPLPVRTLRFSKRMVALALVLIAWGLVLVVGLGPPWKYAMIAGVITCGAGLGTFFTAGYYWACDNESCS